MESGPTQAVLPLGRTRGGESHPRPVIHDLASRVPESTPPR
ncbi:MAG: hypothetical protein ACQESR_15970 [Planctomycetota bacterium]